MTDACPVRGISRKAVVTRSVNSHPIASQVRGEQVVRLGPCPQRAYSLARQELERRLSVCESRSRGSVLLRQHAEEAGVQGLA